MSLLSWVELFTMERFKPINIQEILDGYKENILPEHEEYLEEFDKFHQQFFGSKLVHYKGVLHWDLCPWSWESRVDRCPCSIYEIRKEYVEKLIKLYSGTYVRKKNSCCVIF